MIFITQVNEVDISESSHNQAVQTLREAGNEVTVVVLREVTDEEQINIALVSFTFKLQFQN